MSYETIRFVSAEAVGTITLDRPDQLNALTRIMLGEIGEVLEKTGRGSSLRALILTGSGRGFCAGQDLAEPGVMDAGNRSEAITWSLTRFYHPVIRRLKQLDVPVIAAVNGVAAGAGANLALACDFVLAARGAKFIQAFRHIGLVPDSGGTHVLPRLIGEARARRLMLLGEPLAAETAEAWGMIYRCVDDQDLMAEAEALARQLADGPTRALALTKKALAASPTNDLLAQLEVEAKLQREALATNDWLEGLEAFREKRPAKFEGQ